jgi:cell division protein FtsA
MAVEGDTIIFHRVIPLGGGHIAADLAYGLEIPLDSAEQIKRSYTFGAPLSQTDFTISGTDGVTSSFTYDKVSSIVEPRAEEIAEAIVERVKESGVRLGNWSSIYLTGGGLAINRGGREFLSEKLERPVRELPRKAVKLSSPIYASALGLLDLVIDTKASASKSQSAIRSFFQGLFRG